MRNAAHVIHIGVALVAVGCCGHLAVADPVSEPGPGSSGRSSHLVRDAYNELRRGHLTNALDAANRAVANQSDFKPARFVRSQVEVAIGDYGAAVADASWVAGVEPDRPEAFLQRAVAHLLLHQAVDEIADFNHGLHSELPLSAMNLGNVYALRSLAFEMLGQTSEALADFTTASKVLQPLASNMRAAVLNQRCYFGALIGMFESAKRTCDESINNDPSAHAYPDAHSSRAALRLRTGAWDGAISDYTQSLEQQPGQPMILYGRGLARRAHGDNVGAEADFALASVEEPNIAAIMSRLGFDNGMH